MHGSDVDTKFNIEGQVYYLFEVVRNAYASVVFKSERDSSYEARADVEGEFQAELPPGSYSLSVIQRKNWEEADTIAISTGHLTIDSMFVYRLVVVTGGVFYE